MATLRRRPAYGDPEKSPYKQSRGSLREQFGPRAIGGPATISPRDMTLNGPRIAPADPNTGFTDKDKWNTFFKSKGSEPRPQTPSQMGAVAGGITAPGLSDGNALGTATPASNSFRGRFGRNQPASEPTTPWSAAPAGSFAPTGYESPASESFTSVPRAWKETGNAVSSPTRPPPGAAPGEFLKAAFDQGTSFWNKLGVPIPTPPAGAVQAGTSFKSKFGTGRVDSGAALAAAPINNANEGMRRLLKKSAPKVASIWGA